MHRPDFVDYDWSPDAGQLAADELDVLSILTTTVALFGLGLMSVLSLFGLVAG